MAPGLMYICTAKIIDDCNKRKNPAHYLFMSKQDYIRFELFAKTTLEELRKSLKQKAN